MLKINVKNKLKLGIVWHQQVVEDITKTVNIVHTTCYFMFNRKRAI